MNHSPREQLERFEAAFQHYLDVYMTRRDLASLEEMVSEDFCGYGTGLDEVIYSKEKGMEIFRRDITSAPQPLQYTLHRREFRLLAPTCALAVAELDLETEIAGQKLKLKNLRMTMVLREEGAAVKLCGLHISFPTDVHGDGESFPLKELEDRAQALRRLVEEETRSLKEAYAELEAMIHTDRLTGLSSRYYLEKALEAEWQRYNRFDRHFSLVMLDLNDFKEINDRYGHMVGDEVLQRTGALIREQLRPIDVAGRWGGDEIVLLLPEASTAGALKVARRIQDRMSVEPWPTEETVTVAAGISDIRPGETPGVLFQRVDEALCEAKRRRKLNQKDLIVVRE